MKEDSPQLSSPLIAASRKDDRTSASVSANGLDSLGAHASSRASPVGLMGMWRLTYKDFLPSKKVAHGHKQKFSDLIQKANDWLRKNPDVKVRSCEVITWMDKDERRLGDGEVMVMSRKMGDNINTYHLRGLRLWLAPDIRNNDGVHTKKMNFLDIVPEKSDTIKNLVEKVNRKIDDYQLKGKIVSIQTLWVLVVHNKMDPETVRWTETSTYNSNRAFILRVFYIEEDASKDTIVLKDFVPLATQTGEYEGFDQLVERANAWVKDKKDISLLNMQSILVQKQAGSQVDTGSECFFVIPGTRSDSNVPTEFLRILRVVFSKTKVGKGVDGQAVYPMTYETFTPQLTTVHEGRERVERMKDVFRRMETFLDHNECEILNAETVLNPMQVIPSSEDTDAQPQEIKWLFTVRLYLTSQAAPILLEEPHFQRVHSSRRKKKKDDEVEHPGPIFLRNVVNRRYRNRMVIVAVVAFVALSLIVFLSVYYSYKT